MKKRFKKQQHNHVKLQVNGKVCKYVKRVGESCTANNNCTYPHCGEDI